MTGPGMTHWLSANNWAWGFPSMEARVWHHSALGRSFPRTSTAQEVRVPSKSARQSSGNWVIVVMGPRCPG